MKVHDKVGILTANPVRIHWIYLKSQGIHIYRCTLTYREAKWWQSMTGLNIKDESHIHESILFGFPGRSDDAIVINYCILYAKHYIYVEKLKENKNKIHSS